MTILRWTTPATATLFLLLGAGCPLAGDDGAPPCLDRLREAGATEEQVAQLREYLHDHVARRIELRAAVDRARLDLHRVETDATTGEDAVHAALDALYDARAAMARHHASGRFAARKILGDEVWREVHSDLGGFHRGADHHGFLGEEGEDEGPRHGDHREMFHEHLRRLHDHLRKIHEHLRELHGD